MYAESTIFVVDDEVEVQRSLCFLLNSAGYTAESFSSAEEFLDNYDPKRPGCAVLDVRMPGMNGLELQAKLIETGIKIPVIVMTGYANVPTVVQAMRDGAVDFIEKPYDDELLIKRIDEALYRDAQIRTQQAQHKLVMQRYARLSPREREVMVHLIGGKTTKSISGELAISVKTVDVHRARIFEKMKVDNAVELLRLISECDIRAEFFGAHGTV